MPGVNGYTPHRVDHAPVSVPENVPTNGYRMKLMYDNRLGFIDMIPGDTWGLAFTLIIQLFVSSVDFTV